LTWPWQDRKHEFSWLKASTFALMVAPTVWLLYQVGTYQFGPVPLGGMTYWSGVWATALPLLAAMAKSPTMRETFLTYVQVLVIRTGHTAIANSVGKLHVRLARWLLIAQDRVAKDKLILTHEFIAIMLAVRRAGVTEAVNELKRRGLISCTRGVVTVLNRKGLEKVAGTFYGVPEAEYRRLLKQ
jgi:hypothetical protein